MTTVLELLDVTYQYPRDKGSTGPVLNKANLKVAQCESVAVFGRNGVGKSTLLKVLANLLTPASGELRYQGARVHRRDREYRAVLNYCAGAPLGFYPRLTAVENLRFFSGMKGRMLSAPESAAFLARVGLAGAADVTYAKFSLGMRQRLHLAALLLEPSSVWILDEPTAGLDQDGMTLLETLLREADDKTKVIVSHDSDFLDRVTTRRVVMDDGRLT